MRPVCGPFLLSLLACAYCAAADEGNAKAREAMAILNWKDAISLYEPLQEKAQVASADWNEATFGMATAYQHLQPPDEDTIGQSKKLYEQVINQSKDEDYIARSILNLGRIAELRDYPDDKIDLDGAREKYLEVVKRFPNNPLASEAMLRAGATLVMAYDAPSFTKVKQGIAMLEQWLKDHPKDPLASLMWQYAGNSYLQPLGDDVNALRCYEEADRIGWVDPANQGMAFWRAAQLSERTKAPKLAAKYYRKIIIDTPTSGKAYEAALALKRLGEPVPVSPLLGDLLDEGKTAPATRPATATGGTQ